MTDVQSYLVAVIFTAVSGFSCGYGIKTLEMVNNKEIVKPTGFTTLIFGFASVIAVFIYGVRWGLRTDGSYLIWLPTLAAWLIAKKYGKKMADQFKNELVPWRLPIFGSIVVIIAFYVIPSK